MPSDTFPTYDLTPGQLKKCLRKLFPDHRNFDFEISAGSQSHLASNADMNRLKEMIIDSKSRQNFQMCVIGHRYDKTSHKLTHVYGQAQREELVDARQPSN